MIRAKSINLIAGLFLILILLLTNSPGYGYGSKIGIYGSYMMPNGADAEKYSDPGGGIGIHLVLPVPQVHNYLAGTIGFDYTNLLSETIEFRDHLTGLRIEQQTSQGYFRLYIGGRIGAHGHGFIRPFANVNVALVHYSIGTDVVIPDDEDREKEIRQDLNDEGKTVFGYDFSFGADLNFNQKILIEGGVRYMKSFSVIQQLGDKAVDVSPEYFQIYIGIGVSLGWIMNEVDDD